MEELKPTDRVYLKHRYYSNGNIWYPGHYQFGELPEELKTEKYLDIGKKVSPPTDYNSAIKKQKIAVTATKPLVEKTAYGEPSPTVIANKKTPINININSATAEELAKLKNVSVAIATKIIEARTKKTFADIEDLKSRVKLNRGSWDDIKSNLLF